MIIKPTALRDILSSRYFNINVSHSELSDNSPLVQDIVSISNTKLRRLQKTLETTRSETKAAKIQILLKRRSDLLKQLSTADEESAPSTPSSPPNKSSLFTEKRAAAHETKAKFMDKMEKVARDYSHTTNPDMYLPYDDQRDRFSNILTNKHTNVDPLLNANYVAIKDQNIAIAGQFPKSTQLEVHLNMMMEQKSPVLAVLTPPSEMISTNLPDYFSRNGIYGSIKTTSTSLGTVEIAGGIVLEMHQLKLTNASEDTHTLTVIHAINWEDKTGASSATAKELAQLIQNAVSSAQTPGHAAPLPVVHCRAGIGRTGQVIASLAMQMLPTKDYSLETIVSDIRASRNAGMVQTKAQMEMLMEQSLLQHRPLFMEQEANASASSSASLHSLLTGATATSNEQIYENDPKTAPQQVQVLQSKPNSLASLTSPAIWPSSRGDGTFGIYIPAKDDQQSIALRARDMNHAIQRFANYGVEFQGAPSLITPKVQELSSRPTNPAAVSSPTIWPSSQKIGSYGVLIPREGQSPLMLRAQNESSARTIFEQHGISWEGFK